MPTAAPSQASTQTDEAVILVTRPSMNNVLLNGARVAAFLCAVALTVHFKSATLGGTLLVLVCAHQLNWKPSGLLVGGRQSPRRRTRRNSRSDVTRLDRVTTPEMKSREERRSRDRLLGTVRA